MPVQGPEDSTAAIDAAVLAVSDVVRAQMTALVQSRDAQITALTAELANVKATRDQQLQALEDQINADQSANQTGA